MSESTRTTADVQLQSRPAVGLQVMYDADPDAVAGAILRAQRAGHEVFIVGLPELSNEVEAIADQLEVTILSMAHTANGERPQELLTEQAREAGYPGLIWQPTPAMQVDFQRSVGDLRTATEYCIAAKEQPSVALEPHVLVAIPAYNEAHAIADVVRSVTPHADDVLVVDDGSDDDTAARAHEAGAAVIQHETNQGYGGALKTAFREADRSGAGHLVIVDGDGQHDADDIPRLVRAQQEQEAELVIGSRFDPDSETDLPLYRRIGLAIVNVTTNLSMGLIRPSTRVGDTQCGFRAYDRRAIESLAADLSIGGSMGASTDILHHANARGYDILEVPTTVDYDVEDASTHSPVTHGITLIMNLVQTVEQERPISALGVPGLLLTLLGLGFGYWTFSNYIASGSFPIGTAVTASFFGLVGVFACFTAIILHSLNTRLA